MVTSDVGDQLPHQDASGQLILWFLDPESGFNDATDDDLSTAGGTSGDDQGSGKGKGQGQGNDKSNNGRGNGSRG